MAPDAPASTELISNTNIPSSADARTGFAYAGIQGRRLYDARSGDGRGRRRTLCRTPQRPSMGDPRRRHGPVDWGNGYGGVWGVTETHWRGGSKRGVALVAECSTDRGG